MAQNHSIRQHIIEWLTQQLPLEEETLDDALETPPSPDMGDYALPCFPAAKELQKPPQQIAEELSYNFRPAGGVEEAVAEGPYINFHVDRAAFAEEVLSRVQRDGDTFGHAELGQGRRVVIDYSSPNIAKHLGVHHLRSAIIGKALYNIYSALGFECVGINHLGDWGTGFGKLIAAYERWGDELDGEPGVSELQELYVRYSRQAEDDPELQQEARDAFRRLEQGEEDAVQLWEKFKEVSLTEFERIYDILGIDFDRYTPESYYNDKIEPVLERLKESGLARKSQDALVIPLDEYDMPPLLLQKSDEGSLYATRELCAAEHRWDEYEFHKALYVVGGEQQLHFQQVKKALDLMGHDWADRIVHVDFGLLKFKDPETGEARTGSTRSGDMLLLEDVLESGMEEARAKVRENLDVTGRDLDEEDLASTVGVSAIMFSDLSVRRHKDVIFDWDRMLDFEGDTGPYVQYAHARLCSILRKAGRDVNPETADPALLELPQEWSLVRKIEAFPSVVRKAADTYEPSAIANYLLDLCAKFSSYYSMGMKEDEKRVLCDDPDLEAARLLLVDSVRNVIKNGLNLLGIEAPNRM